MLATAVIVFREVLEAALVVSIVMAASKGVDGRGKWVSAGIGAGAIGACIVAAFAGAIATAVQGRGQELLNAGILFTAVVMLAWHNIWMSQHGKQLAADVSAAGRDVASGQKPLAVLMIVAMMAVLREGSEVALFTYGIVVGGGQALWMLAGGTAGLALGVLTGLLLYKGLLRIPLRQLFRVTGWIILLLAAGLSAQAAAMLAQTGLLPSLGQVIWNTSWLLDEHSLIGNLLHVLVGYTARPSGIQLLFYLATLGLIGGAMRVVNRPQPRHRSAAAPSP